MVDGRTFGATLWRYKDVLIVVLSAVLLLPLPLLVPGKESQCGYIMLIMAIYWCTEALPIPVTGVIPIFTFPLMGLLPSEEVAVLYMQESTLMFFGGLMVALAFEKCNLHRRVALSVLVVMGTKPIWLMLGFMMPTWFLSMWISNTATTSMMIPILEAVLVKLGQSMTQSRERVRSMTSQGHDNPAMNMDDIIVDGAVVDKKLELGDDGSEVKKRFVTSMDSFEVSDAKGSSFDLDVLSTSNHGDESVQGDHVDKTPAVTDAAFAKLCKGMTLAVAYSANIGGTGTLTGTTPNVVMKDYADELWLSKLCTESPINFSSWMVYGVPTALITLVLIWLWLAIFYLGPKGFSTSCGDATANEKEINADIRKEFKALGRMKYAECWTLFVFSAMVLLWFFRSPGFITGWSDLLLPGYAGDSTVSMMCMTALFLIPIDPPSWGSKKKNGKVAMLLDWETVHEKFPWGLIFLVGGGFALAEAAIASGLSEVIGEALTVFEVLPTWFMVTVLAFFTALLTEITSNTATTTLIMPIVTSMADKLALNPLYLMLPCAVASSYAFMLPVSTPPNAIAFSYGRVSVLDMVKTGIVLKLCVFVLTLGTETWGMAYFNFDELPWDNNTLPCGVTAASL